MPEPLERSSRLPAMPPLRVAVVARSVYPFHGVGGLERHVYDLVRHLIAQDVHVTLITKPATGGSDLSTKAHSPKPKAPPGETDESDLSTKAHSPKPKAAPDRRAGSAADRSGGSAADRSGGRAAAESAAAADILEVPADRLRLIAVPYVTFPGAGRRGTTVADRVTAYPFFGWRAGRVAAKLAYRGEVDLVYALGASGLGYAQAHRRHEATPPFVFNPQGLEEFGATNPEHAPLKRIAYGPLQTAVRSCARAADAVIATDRALVPTLLQHLPIDVAHVAVVPNGIDLEEVDRRRADAAARDALRARAGAARDVPLLLSVGRLEANKGFHVLARALALVQQREPQSHWRWALVGDGPFRSQIERVAEGAGVASRMIVAGRVSDAELHGWYDAADLFVHPTLYEGSSLVTLEAMAHARPVIATRAGGLPDKVTPGENGWLVDPDRPDQLAEAVSAAMHASPQTRAAMGRVSRARVEREFAWPVIAGQMVNLYRRLIAAEERS